MLFGQYFEEISWNDDLDWGDWLRILARWKLCDYQIDQTDFLVADPDVLLLDPVSRDALQGEEDL
jgi:hypothetical protein